MYIELWVDCSLDQLGWFLNKKPPTEQELAEKKTIESFKKEFGQGRTTIGSFVQKPDGRIVYQIAIVNDYASFIKSCRDKGLGIYLSSKLMALCPYNLVGVKETLKSTMNNKLGEGWKAIEPSDKNIMTIDSGPWLFTIHRIQQFAEETGWQVKFKIKLEIESNSKIMLIGTLPSNLLP